MELSERGNTVDEKTKISAHQDMYSYIYIYQTTEESVKVSKL